jgi:hypothetical protein
MTAFMHDVARASLPVAIALLAFTAVARAALWADDPAIVRVGRKYLEPLSIWCLGAVGVQLFAVVAAGDAGAFSLLLPIAMGAAAALLRPSEEETPAPVAARSTPPEAAAPVATRSTPPVAPAPAAAPRQAAAPVPSARAQPAASPAPASLWVKRADDGPAREGSLWSR